MTGSVRGGALSNERPYRDRARRVVSTCELDRAPRAHAVGCQWWTRRAKRACAHPTIQFERDAPVTRTDSLHWSARMVCVSRMWCSTTRRTRSCNPLGRYRRVVVLR
jgi:hypothetical protein